MAGEGIRNGQKIIVKGPGYVAVSGKFRPVENQLPGENFLYAKIISFVEDIGKNCAGLIPKKQQHHERYEKGFKIQSSTCLIC